MSFTVALSNVIQTLIYIIPGYILCKTGKVSEKHLSSMSSVLVYVCSACIVLSSFLSMDFSVRDLKNMGLFLAVTLILQTVFILILWLILFKVLKKDRGDSTFRLFTIASVMGNVGFFGLPVIKALLPDNPEVTCYSAIFTVSMNILVFTVGIFSLTGKREYMSVRQAFINPPMIAFMIAVPLYLTGINAYIPSVFVSASQMLASMSTPLCMIVLGIRLATVEFKKLFVRPFVYLICLTKLVIFPVFCFFAVYPLPFDPVLKSSVLVLCSVPCASVILNLSEIYKTQSETAANCILLSTLSCFITIPVVTLLSNLL